MKNLIFFLIFLASIQFIYAQKSIEQKQKELKRTRELLKKVNNQSNTSLKKLQLIKLQINKGNEYINLNQREIVNTESEIKKNAGLQKNIKSKLEFLKKDYNELIYYAYKTRGVRQKTIFILSADDFNQAYKRFKYLQFFTDYLYNATDDLKKMNDSLTTLNKKLKESRRELFRLKEIRADEIILLGNKKTKQNRLVSKLSKEKSRLRRELKKKIKIAENLNKSIKSKAKSETNKPKTAETKTFETRKGKLNLPVTGVITSTFGNHKHPVLENVTIRNDGIEITATGNYNVKAVYKGIVSKIVTIPGANKAVLIRHGQYFTVYSNLSEVYVKENQKINTNQRIGKVFSLKNSADSGVLNFQIWYGNEKLNPQKWLK